MPKIQGWLYSQRCFYHERWQTLLNAKIQTSHPDEENPFGAAAQGVISHAQSATLQCLQVSNDSHNAHAAKKKQKKKHKSNLGASKKKK